MKLASSFFPGWRRTFTGSSVPAMGRAGIAAILCALMAGQPVLAEGTAPVVRRKAVAAPQLQGDERVLHALNRLTFGPRPGDVEAAKAMGLDAWFDRQLNPASIDDSALDKRLELFPAMQMTQAELIERYPSPQMLRDMIRTKADLPADPVLHGIYKDQIAFYKKAQAKIEAAGGGVKTADPKAMDMDATMAYAKGAAGPSMMGGAPVGSVGDAPDGAPQSAPAKKQKNERVNLLGDQVGAGKKKAAAGGDAMAAEAGKVAAGDFNTDDTNLAGRGRQQHAEQFFPEAETQRILALDPEQRLLAILSIEPDQLVNFRRSLSQQEVVGLAAGMNPLQRETIASLQGSARLVGGEVVESRMMRDVYSDRQLEAVMTDFWLNHFNVYLRKNQQEPYLLPAYEREVIRPNALGNFEQLLVATAESPAMLMYLDNFQSVGPESIATKQGARLAQYAKNPQVKQALKDRGLNENYARELMELHTLGVQCEVSMDHPVSKLGKGCGSGYTQADVTNVAKVLTGWTIERPYGGGQGGSEFRFDERRHELGPKVVLGVTIQSRGEDEWLASMNQPGIGGGGRRGGQGGIQKTAMDAEGQAEGLRVLHMLATSPATARFISRKLAVRFVSDNPPEALVDRMAASWVASNGDIKTVLRTMFKSPEFWSPAVYRAKVKTPEEFVVSAVRASGAQVNNALPLVQALNQLGMGFYGMQTPNGYSWKSEPWVSTGALVSRMNFALVLSGNRLAGTRTNWPLLLGSSEGNLKPVAMDTSVDPVKIAAAAKERTLEGILLGQPVSEKTRATVLAQSENTAAPDQAAKEFGAGQNTAAGDGAVPATGAFLTGDMARRPGQQGAQDRQAAVIAGLLLGSPEFQRR
ncbi:Protein of unknown function [Granulicella rosea]|uniref:DUF1800 domain-containing protein n=1 Tax=Granulicella rosea TaxID=474952 RepID=A0A239J744_9BACT|nr:DUF1800 domain-containing protein [Granulicella rosea]SNT01635.1 Protein of unknown function [Granulicella rosea]